MLNLAKRRTKEWIRTKEINMVVFSRNMETTTFPLMFLTPVPLTEVGTRFLLFKKLSPKESDRNLTTEAAAHGRSRKQEVGLLRHQ